MRQNSIKELPELRNDDYANIFNIYTDEDSKYFYNLLQTAAIPNNLPVSFYDSYNVTYNDTWPFISYKLYNTPNLWWVIASVNNITNPLEKLVPGTQIKYLKAEYVSLITTQLTVESY